LLSNEFVCGSTKYDEPIELVYDDRIKFKYTQLEMAQVLYDQFTAPVDEGGAISRRESIVK